MNWVKLVGIIKSFYPEKLVIPVLISCPEYRQRLLDTLTASFGPIDFISRELNFNYSSYYTEEMGKSIKRIFISIHDLVVPQELAEIKIQTNSIETKFIQGGKRKINLDPGFLSLSRFILATTKDGSHRIPLHSGIYAEITLIFEQKKFRPVEWTYPDYRSQEYLDILKEIRNLYKDQLKKLREKGELS